MLDLKWMCWAGAAALSLGVLACKSEETGGDDDGGMEMSEEGGAGNGNGSEGGVNDDDDDDDRNMDASPGGGDGGTEDDEDAGAKDDEDAGSKDDEGDGGGGDPDPSEVPGTLRDLPNDGENTSICYEEADCNGDDLVCFGDGGEEPGLCTEDCAEDSDCSKIDGLEPTCSDGQCLVNCAGDEEEGDGPCPDDMECRDLSVFAGLGDPSFWCVYPADGGSNDVPKLGKCDPDHGDGDCKGERVCADPDGGNGHGFCTDACEEDADCTAPSNVSSVPVCSDDVCELDCSGAGATCPGGMNCRDVNPSPLSEVFRCVYID